MSNFGNKFNKRGRPKGALSSVDLEQRQVAVSRIKPHLLGMIDSQIEVAKGIYYEHKENILGKNGKKQKVIKKVFQKLPNESVGQYLINQVIGKPKEMMEVEHKNDPFAELLIKIRGEHKSLADELYENKTKV